MAKTNNLVFNNGTSLPICLTEASGAPRMADGGWRNWHVIAENAIAAEALTSGINHREYESIVGVDEDKNYITNILTEDLSGYTITSGICDHLDGTVTIWARRPSELEAAQTANAEYIENLKALGIEV